MYFKGDHKNTTTANFTPKSQNRDFLKYVSGDVWNLAFNGCVQALSKCFLTCLNYSSRFLEGVQKEGIQQWRQARSRTGEKEGHLKEP